MVGRMVVLHIYLVLMQYLITRTTVTLNPLPLLDENNRGTKTVDCFADYHQTSMAIFKAGLKAQMIHET